MKSTPKTPMAAEPPLPADFFVLRTPLLPMDVLRDFSAGLEAPEAAPAELAAALQRDTALLRTRLRTLLCLPEVREALFVASPSLDESLPEWERDPEGERGQKVERTLLRYLARMAGRPTPFGLFAGCGLGVVGEQSRLSVGPREACSKHTRLDGDYLSALCEALARDPVLAAHLRYRPNTSLYRIAGQVRYAEARLLDKVRSYHLVAVEDSPYLQATLSRAAGGALPGALAQALCADDPEIEPAAAAEYVGELITHQLLMPELAPAVTGPEPIHGIIADLAGAGAGAGLAQAAAAALSDARDALARLDAAGPGANPAAYRQIAKELEALPAKVDLSRLFQVDLGKPAPGCTLGRDVLEEMGRAVERLRRLSVGRREVALTRFREEFQRRYEEREVPLCEVLDEESGIGFAASSAPSAEAAPLLEGLAFPPAHVEPGPPLGRRERRLLCKLHQALGAGAREIRLDDDDWKALSEVEDEGEPPPLPDSFAVLGTLLAAGPEAAARGDFRLYLQGVIGPSGANLLGRFCHGDEALTQAVRRHRLAEEALRPGAIFAEIVHLPEGRIGNVLLRPVLREYEIPFLGRSGAPEERLLPIDDLLVSIRFGRVVLRSARLDTEVVPRLTTAHNFASARNLGAYRFLCTLQGQGVASGLGFSWGALEGAPYLPRLVSGRLVLSLARWNLTAAQLKPVLAGQGAARYQALQALRQAVGLPRHCAVVDGDNVLPLDLDNVLSVETAVQLFKERPAVTLTECLHGEDHLCAAGPEGRFVHDLVVPFLRRAPAAVPPAPPPRSRAAEAPMPRRFLPGTEWLFVKIYAGTAALDQVLREAAGPVVRRALGSAAAQGWFFIRYSDPDWHLRLRLRGDPRRLLGETLPDLHEALGPLLADGRVWRLSVDSYEREVERYGGPTGMALSEALFQADSEATLAIVDTLSGDEGAEARWRLCLRGMDRLLADLGLDLAGRHQVVQGARASFGREHGFDRDPTLERQIGERFRRERVGLEGLLSAAPAAEHPLGPGLLALAERSERLLPIAAALRQAPLTVPLAALAGSYLHMHANRLLRSAARAQELVLYDFLTRLYSSQIARQRR